MRDGGVNEGLSREVSERLALQTVFGTAAYIMQSGTPVHEVLESICSPGGTTLAGLAAMEEQGFSASVIAGGASMCESLARTGSLIRRLRRKPERAWVFEG